MRVSGESLQSAKVEVDWMDEEVVILSGETQVKMSFEEWDNILTQVLNAQRVNNDKIVK